MDFNTWRDDLFDITYPKTIIAYGITANYLDNDTLGITWGDIQRLVDVQDVYLDSTKNNPVVDVKNWVFRHFPVQRAVEKRSSFLSYNPSVETYNAYVLRSPQIIYATYGVDPKMWMTRKSVQDFQHVVKDQLRGTLIELKPLTSIPASTMMVYPYVMQSVIEKHLDYDKDYCAAVPVSDKECVYIGSERSVERLLLDADGDIEFTITSLKKALKEHYEHTK